LKEILGKEAINLLREEMQDMPFQFRILKVNQRGILLRGGSISFSIYLEIKPSSS
jgi:hypothetical protein